LILFFEVASDQELDDKVFDILDNHSIPSSIFLKAKKEVELQQLTSFGKSTTPPAIASKSKLTFSFSFLFPLPPDG
jgi:hypothetical protein